MEEFNKKDTKITVALDIGTTKVCAIAGRKNQYDKIDVLGVGIVKSEGVSRGIVSNIDKTVKAIRDAIDAAEKNAKTKFDSVHVGIAGQHIKSHHHQTLFIRNDMDSEISQNDVDRLVSDMYKLVLPPGDKILHVLPQEFTVDDEKGIIDPIGMSGIKLEANFHVITGQMTATKNIMRCIEKVGIELADMTLEPIASADAVLSEQEKDAGVALVDIGGGTTDITVFKDCIIRHTAVIPFGGNVITKDIQEGCGVMHTQAEKLKVRYGSALGDEIYDNRIITIPGFRGKLHKEISEKNLARIIQARLEEIFDHVFWEIKRSGFEKKLIAGVVLTGGGSLMKNLDMLVEFHTGMSCRKGEPIEHLAHGYNANLASPIYATSIGLLIHAIKNAELKEAYDKQSSELETQEDDDTNNENLLDSDQKLVNKNLWFNKLFTYTKDFFESSPDSDF
ncbi:MAG: cell division protein FtsA [Saprospiraceae bacterium]